MNLSRETTLLGVYLNASDRVRGKPIYRVVVETARALHLAGASVFLVDFSYGSHRRIHDAKAQRVTVYISSSDTWRGRNLVTAIVEKCRELGIAGATATVGVMGFGKTSRIHRAHLLGLSEDLPERIEIVDQPDRIEVLLPEFEKLVRGGLIVLEDVQVIRYLHDPGGSKS